MSNPSDDEPRNSREARIRAGIELQCRTRFEMALEDNDYGYGRVYEDFLKMLQNTSLEMVSHKVISLLVKDHSEFNLSKYTTDDLSPEMRAAFHDVQHSMAYPYYLHYAENLATWQTVRDKVFDAAFDMAMRDKKPTKEEVSLARAQIKAFAQKHQLIQHSPSLSRVGEANIDLVAIMQAVDGMFETAQSVCKDIDTLKAQEARQLDEQLLKSADSSQTSKLRDKTRSDRALLYDRLFHGTDGLFNDIYRDLLEAIDRSNRGPMMAKCTITPEEILGATNRKMRLEHLRAGEESPYARYWKAPEGKRLNDVESKCWTGAVSHYGSVGEKATQMVMLRAYAEQIMDVMTDCIHPGLLDKDTVAQDYSERFKQIPGLHLTDAQAIALAKTVIDEVEQIQTEKRSIGAMR